MAACPLKVWRIKRWTEHRLRSPRFEIAVFYHGRRQVQLLLGCTPGRKPCAAEAYPSGLYPLS